MKMRIQVTFEFDDETPETVTEEITVLNRQADDVIGLTLNEGQEILSALQGQLVTHQMEEMAQRFRFCAHCSQPHRRNGRDTLIYQTLFGNVHLSSQRYYHCDCREHNSKTFNALANLLPERTAPEFQYLQSKWASLISYGQTVNLLKEVLPVDVNTTSLHRCTLKTAKRLEAELDEERDSFIEGGPSDWAELPSPDQRLFVGIVGGFVRQREDENSANKSMANRHFEIIVGKTMETDVASKRFAFAQTLDEKPKRRVFETLKSHGMAMNSNVTFLTDGANDVRNLPANLNPNSDHVLDWFHLTMKLTNLRQLAKGFAVVEQVTEVLKAIDRIKHQLWHGYVPQAFKTIEALIEDCTLGEEADERFGRLAEKLSNFREYIENNADFIPNYADRQRYGELFSTAFVESAVNEIVSKRMVKKQQMRWSKRGAHLLLQVRVKALDGDLRSKFETWYPSLAPPMSLPESGLSC